MGIIANLSDQLPAWLLLDFDWLATQQAAPYLPRLRDVVVIGRVKWLPGTKWTGKDNCAWMLFSRPRPGGHIRFFGRTPRFAELKVRVTCAA